MRVLFRVNTDAEEESDVLGSEWDQAKAKEAGLRMRGARMRSLGVFVVGDCPELGNWCVERAVRLSQNSSLVGDEENKRKKSSVWSVGVEIGDPTVEKIEYRFFIGQVVNEQCDSVHSWEANPYPRTLRSTDAPPGVVTYGRYSGASCVEAGWLGSRQSEVQLRIHGNDAMTLYDDDSDHAPRQFYIKCLPIDLRRRTRRAKDLGSSPNAMMASPPEPSKTIQHLDSGVSLADMSKDSSSKDSSSKDSSSQDSSSQDSSSQDSSSKDSSSKDSSSKELSSKESTQGNQEQIGSVSSKEPSDKETLGEEGSQGNNGQVLSDMDKEITSKVSSGKDLGKPKQAGKPPMGGGLDDITEYITSDVQVSILTKKSCRTDPPPVVNHPYPQPIEGIPYTPGDFVTFRLRTRKPAEIGFKITICEAGSSDHEEEPHHGKSGMVVGTAFVGRCPAEKSKHISECMISNEFEAVGMLKVDVLVVKPAACVQSRTGLRLARPCSTPSPTPKRISPVPGANAPTSSSISRSLVIGHRGMGSTFNRGVPSAKVTENTIASFERAIRHGADMIEFDVMLTKDMVPIIYHDFVTFVNAARKSSGGKAKAGCATHLEKCASKTEGEGKIRPIRVAIQDLTFEELMSLDVLSAAERDYSIRSEAENGEHKCRHDSGIDGELTTKPVSEVIKSANFSPINADGSNGGNGYTGLTLNDLKEAAKLMERDRAADNVSLCSEEVASMMSSMSVSETRREEAYDSDRSIDSGVDAESTGRFQPGSGKAAAATPDCRCISSDRKLSSAQSQQRSFLRSPCKLEHPFPTLQECFTSLDPRCGFNVEVKHSMQLAEGSFEDDFRSTLELNDYVDAILAVVYEHASEDGRAVVFSSFDPDICIMLRLKQNLFPVLFLSQGEHPKYPPFADSRTRSVADAVQFARSENILGVDLYSGELLSDLGVVRHVKSSALSVYCWGSDNNNHENLKILEEAGVDAIILDRCDEFISGAV